MGYVSHIVKSPSDSSDRLSDFEGNWFDVARPVTEPAGWALHRSPVRVLHQLKGCDAGQRNSRSVFLPDSPGIRGITSICKSPVEFGVIAPEFWEVDSGIE